MREAWRTAWLAVLVIDTVAILFIVTNWDLVSLWIGV